MPEKSFWSKLPSFINEITIYPIGFVVAMIFLGIQSLVCNVEEPPPPPPKPKMESRAGKAAKWLFEREPVEEEKKKSRLRKAADWLAD